MDVVHLACLALASVACICDLRTRRIPQVLTLGGAAAGLVFHLVNGGWSAGASSVAGWALAIAMFLLPFALGGLGAGDVKLLAGVGAWFGTVDTFYSFCATAITGGVLAIAMVLWRREWAKHRDQFWKILFEITTIRDPEKLAAIAAERKKSMLLLPYGIPIAIGTILWFAISGKLI